jgi:hypothetical protein
MFKPDKHERWQRLYYKYSHIGCPAAGMEDNCAHPDRCADNGRCLDLGPSPFQPDMETTK